MCFSALLLINETISRLKYQRPQCSELKPLMVHIQFTIKWYQHDNRRITVKDVFVDKNFSFAAILSTHKKFTSFHYSCSRKKRCAIQAHWHRRGNRRSRVVEVVCKGSHGMCSRKWVFTVLTDFKITLLGTFQSQIGGRYNSVIW